MNEHGQIYLPKMSLINKGIIILCSVLFVLNFILIKAFGVDLSSWLSLSGSNFVSMKIYTLLTYPFVTNSIMELILNCLMLWLMGSEFEVNWGTKRYASFLLTVIIGGGLLYLGIIFAVFTKSMIFSFPLIGLSGVVSSLCVAYAVIYPKRIFSFMMVIPIEAKYFCWILVILALFSGISSPMMVGSWGQLGAILCGFLFMVLVSNRNFKELASKMSNLTQSRGKAKSKAKLTIVKDDQEKPPKYWQ